MPVCFGWCVLGDVRGLPQGCSGCRSRRYSGSRLLIKCQTKQKSTSVFSSGNRPAICSSFIHSLTSLLCVRVVVCVYMCKHSSQQPLAGQVHNVTDVVVRKPTVVCQMARGGSRDRGWLGIGRRAGLKKLGAIQAGGVLWQTVAE